MDLGLDLLAVLALAEGELLVPQWLRAAHRAGFAPHEDEVAKAAEALATQGAVVRGPHGYAVADRWVARALEHPGLRALSDRLAEPGVGRVPTLGRVGDPRVALALGSAPLFDFAIKRSLWSRADPERDPIWVRVLGLHPPAAWLDHLGSRYLGFYLRSALERAFSAALETSAAVLEYPHDDPEIAARRAVLRAARGVPQDSTVHFARAFVALTRDDLIGARAAFGRRKVPPFLLPFALLAELTDERADLVRAKTALDKLSKHPSPWPFALAALQDLARLRAGREREREPSPATGSWIDHLLPALVARYRGLPRTGDSTAVREAAAREGFEWVAAQLGDDGSLGRLWTARASWELALEALVPPRKADDDPDGALWWEVRPSSWDDSLGVTAHWVGAAARKGRDIPLGELEEFVQDPRDRIVAAAVVAAKRTRTRLTRRQLALFVGHPRVRSGSGRHVRVDEREARLVVDRSEDGAVVRLDPPSFDDTGALVVEEPDVLTLVRRTAETERIAKVLGATELHVPPEGLARLGTLLESLPIAVHTGAGLRQSEETGDARLHVRLSYVESAAALLVRIGVIPREHGAEYAPGAPPEVLVLPGLGTVRRNLEGERRALDALYTRCPSLHGLAHDGDDLRADLEVALELLRELEAVAHESFPRVVVSWRAGKPLALAHVSEPEKQIRFTLRGNTKWLAIEGTVRLDDSRILPMQKLLDAMERARGRFVEVAPGEFLELSAHVREALESLAAARRLGVRGAVSAALAPALATWTRGFDVQWDTPPAPPPDVAVPRALQATLRDYQIDGFEFLVQRAAAGRGSILADDMGLGKTVQTLALLLARRARGPALVVAPTSVLHNWRAELRKFAPSLEVTLTSYGLLEKVSKQRWATLVLDEAHALKNPATLRWKAAKAIEAEAIVALTGTPVENHVGELHALLDVVEPGLLGSRAAFRRMVAVPMARGQQRPAALLRRIVRPVVLRRTKAEVLGELPPKTEIVRLVSASKEQRAFYEALRLRALTRLKEARTQKERGRGRSPIELLAEITKLRRAAIDPRLVGGPSAPPGSKLDELVHVVRELRQEGHRALVFSQFLEVLDLAGERLAADDVHCTRLDGTMTPAARAAVIDGFQRGEADVLLASLKAGGVGVNLTAADFVIHLDPWWNPAVEDQATDRAHRMGQTRPVTVMRICTENTVEEKVLAMHGDKRRLYQDVVGEADGAPAFDVEQWEELFG